LFCLFGGWLWLRKNEKIRKALDIWCSTLINQWTSCNYKLTHTQAAQMQNVCTVQTAETNCTGRTYFLLVATALFSEAHYTTKLPCSDRAVAARNGRWRRSYLACLAALRSPRVTAWKPALMEAAVLEAPHFEHSTMVSRVEGSFRRRVAADLHISQVTYSLMYLNQNTRAEHNPTSCYQKYEACYL